MDLEVAMDGYTSDEDEPTWNILPEIIQSFGPGWGDFYHEIKHLSKNDAQDVILSSVCSADELLANTHGRIFTDDENEDDENEDESKDDESKHEPIS